MREGKNKNLALVTVSHVMHFTGLNQYYSFPAYKWGHLQTDQVSVLMPVTLKGTNIYRVLLRALKVAVCLMFTFK